MVPFSLQYKPCSQTYPIVEHQKRLQGTMLSLGAGSDWSDRTKKDLNWRPDCCQYPKGLLGLTSHTVPLLMLRKDVYSDKSGH